MEACVNYVRKQKHQSKKVLRSKTTPTLDLFTKLYTADSRRMTLQQMSRGKLFVTVIRGADLIASSDGKSDPFCVIKIGDNQESATPVINNDLNPVWNYVVRLPHSYTTILIPPIPSITDA